MSRALMRDLDGARHALTGNLFEGEWREGKPYLKDGQKADGPMDWLSEAVASVSANIGGSTRGEYGQVSTHDDDDDVDLHRGRH